MGTETGIATNEESSAANESPAGKEALAPIRDEKSGKIRELTSNTLVVAVVSAIVAGLISLLVALLVTHFQNENASSQAAAGQQAQAAGQLETAANALLQYTRSLYEFQINCAKGNDSWAACGQQAWQVYPNYDALHTTLYADTKNIADQTATELAIKFANASYSTVTAQSVIDGQDLWVQMMVAYDVLFLQCGQLIQQG